MWRKNLPHQLEGGEWPQPTSTSPRARLTAAILGGVRPVQAGGEAAALPRGGRTLTRPSRPRTP